MRNARKAAQPTKCECGAQWWGVSICHCASCHHTFTSIEGFDDHRTGAHANGTRRCRIEAEIRARGYEPNDRGQWRKPMNGTLKHWK